VHTARAEGGGFLMLKLVSFVQGVMYSGSTYISLRDEGPYQKRETINK